MAISNRIGMVKYERLDDQTQRSLYKEKRSTTIISGT